MGFLTPAEAKILILTGACLAFGGALHFLSRLGVEMPVAGLPEAPLVASAAAFPAAEMDTLASDSLSRSRDISLGRLDTGSASSPASAKQGGAPAASPAKTGAARAATGPVDLNRATEKQLCTLPGVGPKTAQTILAWRREHGAFRSVDELDQVKGIGPKKLEKIRGHVTLTPN